MNEQHFVEELKSKYSNLDSYYTDEQIYKIYAPMFPKHNLPPFDESSYATALIPKAPRADLTDEANKFTGIFGLGGAGVFPKFVQSAFENSISGIAHEMTYGKQAFDLSEWEDDHGTIEGLASTILSFFMPLDFLANAFGAGVGSKIAAAGLKKKGVQGLSKVLYGEGKNGISRGIADKYAEKVVKSEMAKKGFAKEGIEWAGEQVLDAPGTAFALKQRALSSAMGFASYSASLNAAQQQQEKGEIDPSELALETISGFVTGGVIGAGGAYAKSLRQGESAILRLAASRPVEIAGEATILNARGILEGTMTKDDWLHTVGVVAGIKGVNKVARAVGRVMKESDREATESRMDLDKYEENLNKTFESAKEMGEPEFIKKIEDLQNDQMSTINKKKADLKVKEKYKVNEKDLEVIEKIAKQNDVGWEIESGKDLKKLSKFAVEMQEYLEQRYDNNMDNAPESIRKDWAQINSWVDTARELKARFGEGNVPKESIKHNVKITDLMNELQNTPEPDLVRKFQQKFPGEDVPQKQGAGFGENYVNNYNEIISRLYNFEIEKVKAEAPKVPKAKKGDFGFTSKELADEIVGIDYKTRSTEIINEAAKEGATPFSKMKAKLVENLNNLKFLAEQDKKMIILAIDNLKSGQSVDTIKVYNKALSDYAKWLQVVKNKKGVYQHDVVNDLQDYIDWKEARLGKIDKGINTSESWNRNQIVSTFKKYLNINLSKKQKGWIFEGTGLPTEVVKVGVKPQVSIKREEVSRVQKDIFDKKKGYKDDTIIKGTNSKGKPAGKFTGLYGKTAWSFLRRFGLRVSEIASISWKDINLAKGTVDIYYIKEKGVVKGKQFRTIELPEETKKLLTSLKKQYSQKGRATEGDNLVFNSHTGKLNVEASTVKNYVGNIIRTLQKDFNIEIPEIKGKGLAAHGFRRSILEPIRDYFEGGENSTEYKLVYEIVQGHKSPDVKRAYDMALKAVDSKAWKNVQDFLDGKDPLNKGEVPPTKGAKTTTKAEGIEIETEGAEGTQAIAGEQQVGGAQSSQVGKINVLKKKTGNKVSREDAEKEILYEDMDFEWTDNLTDAQLSEVASALNKQGVVSPKQKGKVNKAKKHAYAAKISYGITDDVHRSVLSDLGLIDKNGKPTLRSAKSVDDVLNYVRAITSYKNEKQTPRRESVTDWIAENNHGMGFKGMSYGYKALLPVTEVLRKHGGKFGKELATRMDAHMLYEMNYFGEGDLALHNMAKIVGKWNKKKLDLFYMRDEHLRAYGDKSTEAQAFFKSSQYKNANKVLQKYTDFVWREAKKIARNNMNDAEFEAWEKKFSKKYIEDYFTRSLTEDARNLLIENENAKARVVTTILEDIVQQKTDIFKRKMDKLDVRIAEEKNARERNKLINKRAELQQELSDLAEDIRTDDKWRNEAGALLDSQLRYSPTKIVSKNLELERGINLPLHLTDSKGKRIKTYETDFQKTLGKYIRSQSKFLATAKALPEFTDFSGKHTYNTRLKARNWLTTKDSQNQFLEYARKALHEQVMPEIDVLNNPIENGLRYATAISATGGLSSPMSGAKNLVLGSIFDFATYGPVPFIKGWMGLFSRGHWERIRKIGGLELSTKHLEQAGVHKSIQRWSSGMTPTEYANRLRAMVAGRIVAEDAVRLIRGEKNYIFLKGMRERDALSKLKNTFKLESDELRFVRKYGLEDTNISTKEAGYESLIDKQRFINLKIDNNAHGSTQGLTTVPNMPLWTQNKMAKPLLLFYRMAYAASNNIRNNIIKPLHHGNFFPLLRYSIANIAGGALLWELYDRFLGMQKPEDDLLEEYFANAVRGEFLGLGTNLVNPHQGGLLGGFEPVLYRNYKMATQDVFAMATGKKTIDQGIDDLINNYLVVWNHGKRAIHKYTNQYITNYKRVKTLEHRFLEDKGKETQSYRNGINLIKRSPFYRDIRQSFLVDDVEKAAKRYWAAYFFIVDDEFKNGAFSELENPYLRELNARKESIRVLKSSIHSYRPMRFSDKTSKGRAYRRQFFNKYKDNQEILDMVKEAETKHRTLERLFWTEVYALDKKHKYSKVFGKRGMYKLIN